MYLVENYNHQEHLWQDLIDAVKDQPGAQEAIQGFLLAVRDCCVDTGGGYAAPERIKDELVRLAGLDPEAVNAAHLKQRTQRLITNLKLPKAEVRATNRSTAYFSNRAEAPAWACRETVRSLQA